MPRAVVECGRGFLRQRASDTDRRGEGASSELSQMTQVASRGAGGGAVVSAASPGLCLNGWDCIASETGALSDGGPGFRFVGGRALR